MIIIEELFLKILDQALKEKVSDIHFKVQGGSLLIEMRGLSGIKQLKKQYPIALLQYLKYCAHLPLGQLNKPQNGQFALNINDETIFFRLAALNNLEQADSAVLRILNHNELAIKDLCHDVQVIKHFERWINRKSGLIIISGPTGSGKTTTLHTLLAYLARAKKKVITIEDPIEIKNDLLMQLQVNEAQGFSFEQGVKEILRYDPDVILIGEIRDEQSAKMMLRAALSGHLVFTSLHCSSSLSAIERLQDLGISAHQLKEVLIGIANQRLIPRYRKQERMAFYEILDGTMLQQRLLGKSVNLDKNLPYILQEAYQQGYITKKNASL